MGRGVATRVSGTSADQLLPQPGRPREESTQGLAWYAALRCRPTAAAGGLIRVRYTRAPVSGALGGSSAPTAATPSAAPSSAGSEQQGLDVASVHAGASHHDAPSSSSFATAWSRSALRSSPWAS